MGSRSYSAYSSMPALIVDLHSWNVLHTRSARHPAICIPNAPIYENGVYRKGSFWSIHASVLFRHTTVPLDPYTLRIPHQYYIALHVLSTKTARSCLRPIHFVEVSSTFGLNSFQHFPHDGVSQSVLIDHLAACFR